MQSYLKLETILLTKITSDERIQFLNELAMSYQVALYSNSDTNLCTNTDNKGIVSYTKQMPQVFSNSKINLNVTLRSIVSGIPLRALDIMGCAGFLLTNYQPELAEFFEPGRDFIKPNVKNV